MANYMEAKTLNYKTLRKLSKTRDLLQVNHEEIKQSILENKLYKQLKELAKEMIDSVHYIINHRGYYKNAGWQEVNDFMSLVSDYGVRWNKYQKDNLQAYIVRLVDKLIK